MRAYQTYFASGQYDRRYPGANLTTWARILAELPPAAHVVDFGCGSGRYLLRLQGRVARAAGFDISAAAIDLLKARAARAGWAELDILGPDPDALDSYAARSGPADAVLCLFGVLAHIDDPGARRAALGRMHGLLKPGSGRLLVSVPNRRRRFFREQRAAGPEARGRIAYTRHLGRERITLPYQLYDPASLRAELEAAGFRIHTVRAESVLPESWVLNRAPLRWLDRLLTPLCPARWGYGILAVAAS
ncbi:MAG: class I SAM-dependent methyltransferase [Sedimentitalea sp.]|nr:class I SAM-dependent methyltransferase [Sedimentitalea sp.]